MNKGENKIIKKCCMCGKEIKIYVNNSYPVKARGVRCDTCNAALVIYARIQNFAKKARGDKNG